jgi:Glycosyl hydrolase catalytic core
MRRTIIAAIAALTACSLFPATGSAAVQLGVVDVALQNRDPDLFWQQVDLLEMDLIRTSIAWNQIAKKRPASPTDPNDPAYDWTQLDTNVKRAAEWGGTTIYNVWGTPNWAKKYKGFVYYVAVPKKADFRNFMRAVARRYDGTFVPAGSPVDTPPLPRITHWEIWNEANNALGLAVPGGPAGNGKAAGAREYVTVLNVAYNAIHAEDPETGPKAHVIGGAVGGFTGVDHATFFRQMRLFGAKLDGISLHPYARFPKWGPADGGPGKGYLQPYYRIGNIDRFVNFVRSWKGRSLPIWLTEVGWQVNPPDRRIGVPSSEQAKFFAQMVRKLDRIPQVRGVVWYLVRDEKTVTGWQSGVLTNKGTRRPLWYTWRALARARH